MLLDVAVVAGPHGLKGHVKLMLRTDDPALRFQPGVVLDTDSTEFPELTVESVRGSGESWQVKFEEIGDRTAAEGLRGTTLMIETDEWESEEDEFYLHELKGLPVLDVDGNALGTVADIETGGAQDLLVVTTADRGRVRVPFVTQLVPEVTRERVVLDPPGGMFTGEAVE